MAAPLGGHHEALVTDDSSSPVIDSASTVIDEPIEDGAYEPDGIDPEPEPEEPEPEPEPEPRSPSTLQQGGGRSWASVASKAQPESAVTVSTPPQPVTTAAPAVVAAPATSSPQQNAAPQVVSPSPAPVSRETVNPRDFDWENNSKKARHFVIKSYTEDDVRQSLRFNVWASTDGGNRRLDAAYREHHSIGPLYLYFSVNGSGHFCGMAQMTSPLDFSKKVDVWASDKWNGCFTIRWIFVKSIPNNACRHIRLEYVL